jgi:hypothetical protein
MIRGVEVHIAIARQVFAIQGKIGTPSVIQTGTGWSDTDPPVIISGSSLPLDSKYRSSRTVFPQNQIHIVRIAISVNREISAKGITKHPIVRGCEDGWQIQSAVTSYAHAVGFIGVKLD